MEVTEKGARQRLRAVLMIDPIGFIHGGVDHGGDEVLRTLATMVIGGLVTTTVLT